MDKSFSGAFYIGMALNALGDTKEAIKQFNKVIEFSPDSFLAHYGLALTYKKKGMVKKAKEAASKTLDCIAANKKSLLYS